VRRKFLDLIDADDEDAKPRLAKLDEALRDAKVELDEYVKAAGVYLIEPDLTELLYTNLDVEGRRTILREILAENVTVARGAERSEHEERTTEVSGYPTLTYKASTFAGIEIEFKDTIDWSRLGTLWIEEKEAA